MSMNKKMMLRQVMVEANAMTKGGLSRSVATKKAWLVARLTMILATGAICHFSFLKADGTVREMDALPARAGECLIKGTGTHVTPKANMLVVDAELGEFRSFKKANILAVRAETQTSR